MADQQEQPLWQVMEAAWEATPEVPINQEGHCFASMIRALRDWLVPEEPMGTFDDAKALFRTITRDERQRLRVLLTMEADKAEAGE